MATEIALKYRTVPMLLTITPGELLEEPPQIIARGDSHSPYFYRAIVMLNSLLYRYAEAWSGQPKAVKIVKLSIVARVRVLLATK